MKTFSYTITDEVGIHARPAGLLAKKAKEFESVSTIEKGGKSVNITKLMALMGLGVKQGDTVTVTCEGADEDKASEALKAFFEETLLLLSGSWAVKAVQPAGRFCGVFAGASHRLEKE